MIISAIIIGIILIFLTFITVCISNNEDGKFENGVALGVFITMLLFLEVIILSCIFTDLHPTAMDVYQGKTTLEYKVVDGIKVDSVVIFKNDDYGKLKI